jgi:transcriptional regulator with XRE-family HTH domain
MGTPEQPLTVGQRLRAIRMNRGLSLAQVGAALGCHRTNVSHMEAGRNSPGVEQLRIFASLFGCSIDQLVGGELPLRAPPVAERVTVRESVGVPPAGRPPEEEIVEEPDNELRYDLDQDESRRAGEAA